jgi:hypothetical protein
MVGLAPAQSVAPDSILAVLGTLFVAALFYGLTAHVAARYVLGDVKIEQGLLVGPVPAAIFVLGVQVLGQGVGLLVALAAALVGDFLAIDRVYDPGKKWSAAVTVVHYTVTVLVVLMLSSLFS